MVIENVPNGMMISGEEFVKGVDDSGEFGDLESAVDEFCNYHGTIPYDEYLRVIEDYDIEEGDTVTGKVRGKGFMLIIEKSDGEEYEERVTLRKI